MPLDHDPLGHEALLERLAAPPAGGLVVVTPNHRLAAALLARHDERCRAAGRGSWEAPDVLHWSAFLERCHDEAFHAGPEAPAPPLLSGAQAQLLWEQALGDSREAVLSAPATAKLAADAWSLANDWRIARALDGHEANEDTAAFARWRQAYERRVARAGALDPARLAEWVGEALAQGRIPRPAMLAMYAFDLVTPAQADLAAAFARRGVEVVRADPPEHEARVVRVEVDTPRRELEACARWARARLEASPHRHRARIGIVVPDLAQRRKEVDRLFARVLPGGFNLSLGEPLAQAPLVDAALAVLALATGPVDFERASRLLRSPFLAGGMAEADARARLDAALRRIAPATLRLIDLRRLQPGARTGAPDPCPRWNAMLEAVLALPAFEGRHAPHAWARRFTDILEAAGFPGDRPLDSAEYQVHGRWQALLGDLAALSRVATTWDAATARARLRHLALETIFQPASGAAPVQVLGILESAGLDFDHLWVSGLTEEAWPIASRPHAFLPPALQRQAGIPQASAEGALAVDRALTRRWHRAAPEVVFSSARLEGDSERLASPLVAAIPAAAIESLRLPDLRGWREASFAAGREPGAVHERGPEAPPPVAAERARGGTAILGDQAACPFRAFAHFRLEARGLDRPEPGLAAPERGQLLHAMMAAIWERLGDHATLAAMTPAQLEPIAAEAASAAVDELRRDRPGRVPDRFAALEAERLQRIALAWLEIERGRAPFAVRKREEPLELHAGGLQLHGRVDRVDELEDGGLAIIDYKSGRVSVSSWLSERPDDPQLPLYALASGEDVRAVAFAQLRTGALGFAGLARDEGLLPKVPTVEKHPAARAHFESWAQMRAAWREATDRLGESFLAGASAIDPKRGAATCRYCDLAPLCRVHERMGALEEGAPEEDS